MNIETEIDHQQLSRLGRQLSLTENTLQINPLTQNKWGIAEVNLHFLRLQTIWSSAGTHARILIGLHAAFLGSSLESSEAGFIGPKLGKIESKVADLMSAMLPRGAIGYKETILNGIRLISLLAVYASTQLLGQWKGLFVTKDLVDAERAGRFFQELGLIWIFGSQIIEELFFIILEGMNLKDKDKTLLSRMGSVYILMIIIATLDVAKGLQTELLESIASFIEPQLNAIQELLERAFDRNVIEQDQLLTASNQIHLMKQTIENGDMESIPALIQDCFDAFDISYDDVKKEVTKMQDVCLQLNKTFNNILFQADKTITSMDQAA
ncbi:MAG: hypothetical protein H0W88_04075 [Parachlamydiaceae bacterium]|nr:hypothetical protein [Parachlamydiaceae bacterium]